MQTQTHALIALGLLARPEQSKAVRWGIFTGSLLPDLFIYIAWPWLTFVRGHSQEEIWREIYFAAPMQGWGAVGNSFPLWGALLAVALLARPQKWAMPLALIAAAALLHLVFDIFVHAEDAHRHFWPLSDWRFHSPVSYWNPDYHAVWVSLVEAVIGLTMIGLLWRRFSKIWTKVLLAILAVGYVALWFGLYVLG